MSDFHSDPIDKSFHQHFHKSVDDVSVKGYEHRDGSFTKPHMRSHADGNPFNNWSFPGNENPYTHDIAHGNATTYLSNHDSNFPQLMQHPDPLSNVHLFRMSPLNLS